MWYNSVLLTPKNEKEAASAPAVAPKRESKPAKPAANRMSMAGGMLDLNNNNIIIM